MDLIKSNLGPKMLFAPPGFDHYDYTDLLPKLQKEVPELEKFIIMKDIAGKYTLKCEDKFVDYEKYIQQYSPDAQALPKTDISPHDMVNVQFTSGSTGLPKNVALSHYNIMNCGRYIWQQVRMTDEDKVCLPVPLFHSFGMIVGKLHCVYCVQSLLTYPRHQFKHCGRLCFSATISTIQLKEGS